MVPFTGQERLDLGTTTGELDAVTPDGVDGIGKRDLGRVAAVPAILGQANLFDGAFAGEGRQGWAGHRGTPQVDWLVGD
ncbi:hypothetical protein D3C77_663740 [compost metagenome]